jgi:NAD(P)-dependent dehydrogenase (short-subunit alcohol dehydrogenase family)
MASSPKTILITGASSGLGKAMAIHLASQGHQVFVTLRDITQKNIFSAYPNIHAVKMDVCDEASISSALKEINLSGLDVLINNAGIALPGAIEELSKEEMQLQFNVNVFGVISVCQQCIPLLRINKGKIINIGSMSSRMAIPFVGIYGASKAALKQLTWSLRLELKPWEIDVFHFELGNFPSAIWKKAFLSEQEIAKSKYAKYLANVAKMMKSRSDSFNSPEILFKEIDRSINNKNKNFNTLIGKDAKNRRLLTTLLPFQMIENKLVGILKLKK